jgi:hypothetical protein
VRLFSRPFLRSDTPHSGKCEFQLQEENGEEDRFESDSEGKLSGRSEQSESREMESESEIQSVIPSQKSIPEAGSVAMFNKLSAMADEFMKTVKQLREQASSSKEVNVDPLHLPGANPKRRSLNFTPPRKARELDRQRRRTRIWNGTLCPRTSSPTEKVARPMENYTYQTENQENKT